MSSYTAVPDRLIRSELIVPASDYSKVLKAVTSAADAICIDLEDAVAPTEKENSRANVIKALRELDFGRSLRVFRINGLDTCFAYRDLIEVVEQAGDRLDLVIVPKVNRPEDIYVVDTLLSQIEEYKKFSNRIGIEAQIETALGSIHVNEIAAVSNRLEAIMYGPGDYAASVQMPLDAIGAFDDNDRLYPAHRWHYAMHRVVVAARAYGKRCLDGPFVGLQDAEGFKQSCKIARVMGFDGKWIIHPNQIVLANDIFLPEKKQIIWAKTVIDEYDRALQKGRGAIAVNGKMIDAASLRLAQNIVEKAKMASIEALEEVNPPETGSSN